MQITQNIERNIASRNILLNGIRKRLGSCYPMIDGQGCTKCMMFHMEITSDLSDGGTVCFNRYKLLGELI